METKKHGFIMGTFMVGSMTMGVFMNVFDNIFSGKEATTISRLENQKKHGHATQQDGDDTGNVENEEK